MQAVVVTYAANNLGRRRLLVRVRTHEQELSPNMTAVLAIAIAIALQLMTLMPDDAIHPAWTGHKSRR